MTAAARLHAEAARGPLKVALTAPTLRVSRGTTFELTILVTLEPGWSIASVAGDPLGLTRATSLQLGVAEGLTPGPMRLPEGSVNPLGGERIAAYAGSIAIGVPITVERGSLIGPAPIATRVLFQAQREGRVLPPDQIEVAAEVIVSEPAPAG